MSQSRSQFRNRLQDERGATLVMTALGMLVMLGMVALAVDVGMLLDRKTESQRAADAAALAGVASFITAPADADRPRDWAKEYGAKNMVDMTAADVRDEDVDVLVADQKVRVRVRNINARSNAVATIFGRVLGYDEMDVGTVAAAQVVYAGAGNCPLPIALPNRWTETDADNLWDGAPTDVYAPYVDGVTTDQCADGEITLGATCDHTGYNLANIDGAFIEIKTRGGPADDDDDGNGAGDSVCTAAASWRCWFQPYAIDGGPGGGGANALRPWIDGCPDETLVIHGPPDPTILYAGSGSGNMQSLVHQNFENLVDNWPGEWNQTNPGGPCATIGGADGPCIGSENLRVRFMPLISAPLVQGNGANLNVPVDALACVWVDHVAEAAGDPHGSGANGRKNVYVRLTDTCTGLASGGGPILRALQLVE